MIDAGQALESLTLVTPLGIRFWDEVSNDMVKDGLLVTAYPPTNPERRVQAFTNPSGVYVLRYLPGLHAIENGAGDTNFWSNLPPRRPFVIEVQDGNRRFQPFLFTADVPVQGLFTWECGSPPSPTATMVPLYSSPARPVPGGMAVLRADLWDQGANAPAAWAVIEANIPGQQPIRGIADYLGRVALIFPYPEPLDFVFDALTSLPSVTTGLPLTQHEWPIQLQAGYIPQHPVPLFPDLCATLTQPAATLWADAAQSQPLTEVTLKFGQELVVRSHDSSSLTQPSVLYITSAASPPH
jgi:hypothetical protein